MTPVHPAESKYPRALFAASLHVQSGTLLSAGAVREVCEELLRLAQGQAGQVWSPALGEWVSK